MRDAVVAALSGRARVIVRDTGVVTTLWPGARDRGSYSSERARVIVRDAGVVATLWPGTRDRGSYFPWLARVIVRATGRMPRPA